MVITQSLLDSMTKSRSIYKVPVSLYVEFLLVITREIINEHIAVLDTQDESRIFTHMKIYFAHMINGVYIQKTGLFILF
jgi:hypothetical protein